MLIRMARDKVAVTDAPYNADPTGVKSAAEAFENALEDAPSVEVPPGRYRIPFTRFYQRAQRPGLSQPVGVVLRQSGRTLWGHGASSVIHTVLPVPDEIEDGGVTYGHPNAVMWFWNDWDTSHLTYRGLRFIGDGPPDLDPSKQLVNLIMSVIECAYPHPDYGYRGATDVTVQDCIFERQFGFPVHARAGGDRFRLLDSSMIDCMNGANIIGDDCEARGNRVLRSEGFENVGHGFIMDNNRFVDVLLSAIACGGHTGPGSHGNRSFGARITNTIVRHAWRYGIELSTNVSDVLVQGNFLERCRGHAVIAGGGGDGTNPPRNIRLYDNDVLNWGTGNDCAFYLTDVDGARVHRNTARFDPEVAGFTNFHGMVVRGGRNIQVDDNDLAGAFSALSVVDGTEDYDEPARNVLRGRRQIDPDVRRRVVTPERGGSP